MCKRHTEKDKHEHKHTYIYIDTYLLRRRASHTEVRQTLLDTREQPRATTLVSIAFAAATTARTVRALVAIAKRVGTLSEGTTATAAAAPVVHWCASYAEARLQVRGDGNLWA